MFTTSDNGLSWTQLQILLANDNAIGNEFGISVSVFLDVMLVGSLNDGPGKIMCDPTDKDRC